MTQEEQVLIRGKCFMYKQKAPFLPSGKSVFGAIEYKEATGTIRCHECGEWFQNLAGHAFQVHGINAATYKRQHGLRNRTALVTPSISVRLSQNMHKRRQEGYKTENFSKIRFQPSGNARKDIGLNELRNENGTCQAQILDRIRRIAERHGRTPTTQELRDGGLDYKSACLALNVRNMDELVSLAGLLPRDKSKYSKPLLMELLRSFYVKHKRLPLRKEWGNGLIPRYQTFLKIYGSLEDAYKDAGLLHARRPRYTKESLANMLRDFYVKHERRPQMKEYGKNGLPAEPQFCYHFGTMAEAYKAAGLPA